MQTWESIPHRCIVLVFLTSRLISDTTLTPSVAIAAAGKRRSGSRPSWRRRQYSKRKSARRAASSPFGHSLKRLLTTRRLLTRHHGSSVGAKIRIAIAQNMGFQCQSCNWEVHGKQAIKNRVARGHCGGDWCGVAVNRLISR